MEGIVYKNSFSPQSAATLDSRNLLDHIMPLVDYGQTGWEGHKLPPKSTVQLRTDTEAPVLHPRDVTTLGAFAERQSLPAAACLG